MGKKNDRTHPWLLDGSSAVPSASVLASITSVWSKGRSGTGGGFRAARRCLIDDGLRFSATLPLSEVAWSKGGVEEDGDPLCCFGPRDGGGGGGRLRKELWSGGGDLCGIGTFDGVGEVRRPGDCLGLSKGLLSPVRRDASGFGGNVFAFCSNKLLRSFTAGVIPVSMSITCERGEREDILQQFAVGSMAAGTGEVVAGVVSVFNCLFNFNSIQP
jgi:hypothetical protein